MTETTGASLGSEVAEKPRIAVRRGWIAVCLSYSRGPSRARGGQVKMSRDVLLFTIALLAATPIFSARLILVLVGLGLAGLAALRRRRQLRPARVRAR
jgi:hypothetical protein